MGCLDPSEPLSASEKTVIALATLAAAGLGWRLLALSHPGVHPLEAMASPGSGHGSVHLFLPAYFMWVLMMAAMMLPTALPWILFYARLTKPAGGKPSAGNTLLFALGYLWAWALFSLPAAALQVWLQGSGLLHGSGLVAGYAGGVVLIAAGLYQFTPFKDACLTHCRSPLTYFLASWRDGPAGGFSMGLRHGSYCTGCCWALMAVSFAVGVMNFAWMAVLTVFLVIEKASPWGVGASKVFGVALAFWGAALIFL